MDKDSRSTTLELFSFFMYVCLYSVYKVTGRDIWHVNLYIVYITIVTTVSHYINDNHNTFYTILWLKINISLNTYVKYSFTE